MYFKSYKIFFLHRVSAGLDGSLIVPEFHVCWFTMLWGEKERERESPGKVSLGYWRKKIWLNEWNDHCFPSVSDLTRDRWYWDCPVCGRVLETNNAIPKEIRHQAWDSHFSCALGFGWTRGWKNKRLHGYSHTTIPPPRTNFLFMKGNWYQNNIKVTFFIQKGPFLLSATIVYVFLCLSIFVARWRNVFFVNAYLHLEMVKHRPGTLQNISSDKHPPHTHPVVCKRKLQVNNSA